MSLRPVILVLALSATACVGKAKYEAVETALSDARSELASSQDQNEKLKKQVEASEARIAELGAQIEGTKGNLAKAEAELAQVSKQLQAERGEKAELLKTRARLTSSIAEMTAALDDLARRKAAAEKRVAEFKDLVARFQDLIDAGKLQVQTRDGRMVVQLATDVLFSSGKADLSDEGRKAVREVGDVLKTIPDRSFQVEGHTDNVPISNAKYPSNWELASARSITVVREMLSVGMPSDRISAASYAEFDPIAPNRTKAGKARNRRIQIVIVPDLSSLPGYAELAAMEKDGDGE